MGTIKTFGAVVERRLPSLNNVAALRGTICPRTRCRRSTKYSAERERRGAALVNNSIWLFTRD
jgi:hypothetical protein